MTIYLKLSVPKEIICDCPILHHVTGRVQKTLVACAALNDFRAVWDVGHRVEARRGITVDGGVRRGRMSLIVTLSGMRLLRSEWSSEK